MFLSVAFATIDIIEIFGRLPYLGPWIVLMLCGLGAPLPEEAALIPAGIMLANPENHLSFLHMSLVCTSGILLGDSLPFVLGKRYGLSILKLRWVSKILHPERFASFERRFAEHGNWAIFTCRFLPGLRIPGYFIAGTLKMSFLRFLVLDSVGVLISVPTSIYAAKWVTERFGEAQAQRRVHEFMLWVAIAVVVAVVGFVWIRSVRRRRSTPPATPGA
ncbi:MAG: DedA family protein [Planctomycetes bacterium]|nr:DedA family protein [Planctomycetota bacterium]